MKSVYSFEIKFNLAVQVKIICSNWNINVMSRNLSMQRFFAVSFTWKISHSTYIIYSRTLIYILYTSKTHRLRRYRITKINPPILLPQRSASIWAYLGLLKPSGSGVILVQPFFLICFSNTDIWSFLAKLTSEFCWIPGS